MLLRTRWDGLACGRGGSPFTRGAHFSSPLHFQVSVAIGRSSAVRLGEREEVASDRRQEVKKNDPGSRGRSDDLGGGQGQALRAGKVSWDYVFSTSPAL